jgi:hypothetical protein
MKAYRRARVVRWLTLLAVAGILPSSFFLRCDKAALNFQRGFFQALGAQFSELVADPLIGA